MNNQEIEKFQRLYQHLDKSTVNKHTLSEVYADNVQFIDPFHRINGIDRLSMYFEGLYQNIDDISFTFGHCWLHQEHSDGHAFIRWQMQFSHPRIKAGEKISVDGGSELIWQNHKIIQHQDLFDAGQMIYEHLPVLGWVIRRIKGNMQ